MSLRARAIARGIGALIAVLVLGQAANLWLRQKEGYYECRSQTAPEIYYFEFKRDYFSWNGTCPRTGAFDAFAVATGKASIEECLKAFHNVEAKGAVCAKVPAAGSGNLAK